MKTNGRFSIVAVLLFCLFPLLLVACSEQGDADSPPKLKTEQITQLVGQIKKDVDLVRSAALTYKEEKGTDATNSRAMKGYLETWPKPPVEVRDASFKFEWGYSVVGTIGDMGGPSEEQDTVVFLEGVNAQLCEEYNQTFTRQKKVWDFVGKSERPEAETWCENGGSPYRVIRVVSLR